MKPRKTYGKNQIDFFSPKPLHPTAESKHAFFGSAFVHQHMIMDERWTPSDLMDQYENIVELLKKRVIFKEMDNKHIRRNLRKNQQELRGEIQDGRAILQGALHGESARKLRRLVKNNKGLQRLYAKLPIDQILEFTNTRTFKMRKERDRLASRLDILKTQLQDKLIEREKLKTRIKYENEFVLQDELRSNKLQKNLCNLEIRLKTIRTINVTYKKMIKVLKQDAIYFEPILGALSNDIEDQEKFIQHILYLGYPVRDRQFELIKECYFMDQNIRSEFHVTHQSIQKVRNSSGPSQSSPVSNKNTPIKLLKHSYERETKDMKIIHDQLKEIEREIKLVQEATLCSKPKYVCSTFKRQMNLNKGLKQQIDLGAMKMEKYSYKKENSLHKKIHIKENFVRLAQFYAEHIEHLESRIAKEDGKKNTNLEAIKRNSDIWVVLRFALWNIFDILRHVEDHTRVSSTKYPNQYLGLPWYCDIDLKNPPPKHFDENVFMIYNIVKQKLQRVLDVYDEEVEKLSPSIDPTEKMSELVKIYHEKFLKTSRSEEHSSELQEYQRKKVDIGKTRNEQTIPNRKYIKDLSAKIVELNATKDM